MEWVPAAIAAGVANAYTRVCDANPSRSRDGRGHTTRLFWKSRALWPRLTYSARERSASA